MSQESLLPNPESRPTLSIAETARILGISRPSLYKAIESGEVPSIRLGRRIQIPTVPLWEMLTGRVWIRKAPPSSLPPSPRARDNRRAPQIGMPRP